ncbi:hypothetical protein [Gracilibacillus boraciitolerans]|uniref:hypothetical protein n=1 Tax=Gracilibacillus boraciitolerans TaxID=307521 RepID=UPI001F2E1B84|nr:hypothetical protein [Gracilibacillus boraciitolerans]
MKNSKWSLKHFITYYNHRIVQLITACIVIMIVFFLVSFQNVSTETYEIEKFSAANQTIRSPNHN